MSKKKPAPKNNGINYGRPIISWRAPEYQDHQRDEKWVLFAGVFALLFIVWAIWEGTYTTVIVIVLIAGLYYLTNHHTPKDIDISLTTSGILANGRYYPYSNMQTFWVIYNPEIETKTISFEMKSGLNRGETLQLGDQDPSEVRSFLSAHVQELEGRGETVIEKIIRILKL